MKRTAAILIIFAIIAALPAFAFAEGTPHTIDEYDISLVIPEGYRLISPDMDPDDPLLLLYGMTIADIRDMFDLMPLYMDAAAIDGSGEITVTVQESTLPDYRDLGQSALEVLNREMTAGFSEMGVEVSDAGYYSTGQTAFTYLYFDSSYAADCGVQYYTVYGGKSYSFALHSFTGNLPEEKDQIMKDFMARVRFNSMPEWICNESEAFEYIDELTGASFSLPENWEQPAKNTYDGIDRYTFASLRDPSASIAFASSDLWAEFALTQKLFNTRGSIDNSKISYSDAADIIGVSESKVDRVEINGLEYFHADFTSAVSGNGTLLYIPASCLFRVSDGNLYMFIYVGSMESPAYSDFEAVLESVEYADIASGGVAPIVYVLAVAAAIAVIIIIFASRAKKKKRLLKEEEEARLRAKYEEEFRKKREEEAERKRLELEKRIICPKCGNPAEPGDKFCGSCGEKISEAE